MKKWLKILLIVIVLICLLVLALSYFGEDNILETGPENYCESDDDCYCRIFTGAEFLKGKDKSVCCIGEDDERFRCSSSFYPEGYAPANSCALCLYS